MGKNHKTCVWSTRRIIPCILVLPIICILLASCSFQDSNTQQSTSASSFDIDGTKDAESDSYDVVVKGLVLKYILVDTAYEMYEVNVLNEKAFSSDSYSRMGDDSKNHHTWLTNTYASMGADNRLHLQDLFESGVHAWKLMNLTTRLDDSAGVDDIVQKLASSKEARGSSKLKAAITDFLPYFYSNYLKAYIEENNDTFNRYAEGFNKQIQGKDADIIGFMETVSGIKFRIKYKPVFYFTLRPVGAMGFEYKNQKISTIQRTCTDYEYLFEAPFHEYTHELFKTFTNDKEFNGVVKSMEKNKEFYDKWSDSMKNNYNWAGWCEENLVEGFAKYLTYKYYNREDQYSIYPFDVDFCKYLKEKNFDGQKGSLKEICIEFYKSKLQE